MYYISCRWHTPGLLSILFQQFPTLLVTEAFMTDLQRWSTTKEDWISGLIAIYQDRNVYWTQRRCSGTCFKLMVAQNESELWHVWNLVKGTAKHWVWNREDDHIWKALQFGCRGIKPHLISEMVPNLMIHLLPLTLHHWSHSRGRIVRLRRFISSLCSPTRSYRLRWAGQPHLLLPPCILLELR